MSHSYDYYVKEGRKLVHAVEVYQCSLAWMACQVVTIRHGGKYKGNYTLSQYAADIGVHRKTLSEWTITYRSVIEKLDLDPSKISKEEWNLATRVSNLLRNEKKAIQEQMGLKRRKGRGWDIRVQIPTERIKELFYKNKDERCEQVQVHGYIEAIIRMKNKLRGMDLREVNEQSLKSLKQNLDAASSELTDELLRRNNITNLGGSHVALS